MKELIKMEINILEDYIKQNDLGYVSLDYSFKQLTTLKVGGKIALTFFPKNQLSFLNFYFYYLENCSLPLFIIGNGSNVLANDTFYEGVVVSFKKMNDDFIYSDSDGVGAITVSGGCMAKKLANYLFDKGLKGAEALASIPATIGGIISMNATCYGFTLQEYLYKCLVIENNKLYWLSKDQMKFGYRTSIFLEKKLIILQAIFSFPKGEKENIRKRTKEILKLRKNSQPIKDHSAGSVFKNGKDFLAWEIIDKAGLRGFSYNGAQVSNLHANFIINNGEAESKDIYELMRYVQKVVKDRFNIDLENEWILVNFEKK